METDYSFYKEETIMKDILKAAFSIGLMTAVGGAGYAVGTWATTKLCDKIDEKLKEKAKQVEFCKNEYHV